MTNPSGINSDKDAMGNCCCSSSECMVDNGVGLKGGKFDEKMNPLGMMAVLTYILGIMVKVVGIEMGDCGC